MRAVITPTAVPVSPKAGGVICRAPGNVTLSQRGKWFLALVIWQAAFWTIVIGGGALCWRLIQNSGGF